MTDVTADAAVAFWAAAPRPRLMLPRCLDCDAAFWFPRPFCPTCGHDRLEWFESTGEGTAYAVSVHHRAPSTDFWLDSPYVVALVDLDDDVRMLSNVVGDGAVTTVVGDRVRLSWALLADGHQRPVFERA